MDSRNGHTAREALVKAPLPRSKDDWPGYKLIRDAAVVEQAAADREAVDAERLKAIGRLAKTLRFYCRAAGMGEEEVRWRLIGETVGKITEILKGK